MGKKTKVQMIKRESGYNQPYVSFPKAIAEAMEFEEGECIEWTVTGKDSLTLKRCKGG